MSKLRGHDIERSKGVWVYSDTKEPTAETHTERSCGHCRLSSTEEGHDGCIGTLEDVMNACCGHGETESAYIQFTDGGRIAGQEALDYIENDR